MSRPVPPSPDAGSRQPGWLAALLLAAALAALYQDALRAGFLNDDYVFLEQIRESGPVRALLQGDPLSNYYRPISRQAYFSLLLPLTRFDALAHHLVNFAVFLGALALLWDLLRRFGPAHAALVGAFYFAVLHGQRVALTWVSCAQDLLALLGVLGSLALFVRGRRLGASLAYAAAVFSKESALPLPAVMLLWARWEERRAWRDAARRAAGPAAVAALWVAVALAKGVGRGGVEGVLRPGARETAAAYVHMAQSFLFLEHPQRWAENLAAHGPSLAALALALPLALWFASRAAPAGGAGSDPGRAGPAAVVPPGRRRAGPAEIAPLDPSGQRRALRFGLAWCALFGIPLAPVAHAWSAYYYTLAAVGAAVIVAALAARADRWAWVLLAPALLWLHAGASGARAFAVQYHPWAWTSHLTPFYFERGAGYVQVLSRQIRELAPRPEPHSRFYFATLPTFAGFQMGNGPLLRALYNDRTIESYYYMQFSDSNAADRPCDFFYWDGAQLKRLYPLARGRFTQVAGDLFLADRFAGARHALRRALAGGEDAREAHYWTGWAELALGDRAGAEAAWRDMGARDDSAAYWGALGTADAALARGDSATARRALLAAIPYHVGRPEAHRALGALLFEREPKYALMELRAAAMLDPRDPGTHRWLAAGYGRLGMTEIAADHAKQAVAARPELADDPEIARLLRQARAPGGLVMEFGREESP